jgi:hypothetical protein
MSGFIGDIFSSQNLTRAQSVAGVVSTARATFNSGISGRNKAAVAGSLISNIGGILNSFNGTRRRVTEGFNVSNFISSASKLGGFANPAHFLVYVTPPRWVIRQTTAEGRSRQASNFNISLPFLCYRAQLPGVVFGSRPVAHFGYSTPQKRPTAPIFDDITLEFYMDNTGVALDFYTKWLQNIINYDPDAIGTRTTNSAFYNEVQYMENYATQVDIYLFDATATEVLHVKLHEAYPLGVGKVDLNWRGQNSIAVLPISMTFRTWSSNFFTPATIDPTSLRNLSLGDALIRIGSGVSTISSLLRRPTGIADIFNTVRTASSVTRFITGG